MDIKDYVDILWRRKWIVLLTTVAALAVAVVGTGFVKPAYQASTTLRVAASASGPLGATAVSVSNQLINTTAQIAASRPMLDQVVTQLNLKELPVITSAVIPQTELIKITVQHSNPQVAAKVANTLAGMLIAQSNELYTGGTVSSQEVLAQQLAQYKADLDQSQQAYNALLALTPAAPADKVTAALDTLQLKERNYETLQLQYDSALLQQQVRSNMTTVVEAAIPPKSPIAPQATYNYLLGFALGLFFGIVLAFLVESFDPTLYTTRHVEKAAALDIVAKIPKATKGDARMTADATSSVAEAFRSMAAGIIGANHQKPQRVLLITSAEPQQGKSVVAANLATALAEYGMNVVAVDCDMRRPKLHELFRLPNEAGLSNILSDESDLKSELRHPGDCISVLTSGAKPANPSQLLGLPKTSKLVSELHRQFDFVLLDTPAVLAVSDTPAMAQNAELAENIDAIFLVVRQGHAHRDPVAAASKFAARWPGKAVGIILNEANDIPGFAYYEK